MPNIYDMTDTWGDSGTTFTSIKMSVTDNASSNESLLLDLRVNEETKFSVDKTGKIFPSQTDTNGIDSATALLISSNNILTTVDSDYIQSRVTLDGVGIDSSDVISIIDSDYIQARIVLDGSGIDSAATISLINQEVDSDYVQARQVLGAGQTETFTAAEAISKDDLVVLNSSGEAELVSLVIDDFSDPEILGSGANVGSMRKIIRDTINNKVVVFSEKYETVSGAPSKSIYYSVMEYDEANDEMVSLTPFTLFHSMNVVGGGNRENRTNGIAFDTSTGHYLLVWSNIIDPSSSSRYYDSILGKIYTLTAENILSEIEPEFVVSDPVPASGDFFYLLGPSCEYNSTLGVFGVFYLRYQITQTNWDNKTGNGTLSLDSTTVQYTNGAVSLGAVSSGLNSTASFSNVIYQFDYHPEDVVYNSSSNKFVINIGFGNYSYITAVPMDGLNTVVPSGSLTTSPSAGSFKYANTTYLCSYEGTSLIVATGVVTNSSGLTSYLELYVYDISGDQGVVRTLLNGSIDNSALDSLKLNYGGNSNWGTDRSTNARSLRHPIAYIPSSNKFMGTCRYTMNRNAANPSYDTTVFDFTVDPSGASITFGDARIRTNSGTLGNRYSEPPFFSITSNETSDVAIVARFYVDGSIGAMAHSADTVPNYDDWVGISNNDAVQGEDLNVTIPSGVHTFDNSIGSSSTIGADYVVDVTGDLILSGTETRRSPKIGRKISSRKLVLYPYRFY